MKDYRMSESVSVKVTKKRYKELRRLAKQNGHTISWLMNFALDLYFQSVEPQAARANGKEGQQS
jgi:hypothetical protein